MKKKYLLAIIIMTIPFICFAKYRFDNDSQGEGYINFSITNNTGGSIYLKDVDNLNCNIRYAEKDEITPYLSDTDDIDDHCKKIDPTNAIEDGHKSSDIDLMFRVMHDDIPWADKYAIPMPTFYFIDVYTNPHGKERMLGRILVSAYGETKIKHMSDKIPYNTTGVNFTFYPNENAQNDDEVVISDIGSNLGTVDMFITKYYGFKMKNNISLDIKKKDINTFDRDRLTIYNNEDIVFKSKTFKNITIVNYGKLKLIGCEFQDAKSSAIENHGDLTFEDGQTQAGQDIILERNNFTNCAAINNGGGIDNDGTINLNGEVRFQNCSARLSGGGIYSGDNGIINFNSQKEGDKLSFLGCSAYKGGGIYYSNARYPLELKYGIFADNITDENTDENTDDKTDTNEVTHCSGHGAAIYSEARSQPLRIVQEKEGDINFSGCIGSAIEAKKVYIDSLEGYVTFDGCESGYADGGAILAYSIEANMAKFTNCHSSNGFGGAVYILQDDKANFNNCIFESNKANGGGAIRLRSNTLVLHLKKCSFINNELNDGHKQGSAISCYEYTDDGCSFENGDSPYDDMIYGRLKS